MDECALRSGKIIECILLDSLYGYLSKLQANKTSATTTTFRRYTICRTLVDGILLFVYFSRSHYLTKYHRKSPAYLSKSHNSDKMKTTELSDGAETLTEVADNGDRHNR